MSNHNNCMNKFNKLDMKKKKNKRIMLKELREI